MELLTDPQAWIAFLTLVALEVVLGIDNIVFLSILTGRVAPELRQRARSLGLSLALIMRILLLLSLSWIIHLTEPLFTVFGKGVSVRDIVLILGGLFLMTKATLEIHHKFDEVSSEVNSKGKKSFIAVLLQIALIDLVFSLDSVITAVGMVEELEIMIGAVVVSVLFMWVSAKTVGDFVENNPTVKMLAMSFLLLIGMVLVAEGFGHHVPKGYIYFSLGFSIFVESLNLKIKSMSKQAAD